MTAPRRSDFNPAAPRLELDKVISDHDFVRKLCARTSAVVFEGRANCAELRARQKGRPNKRSKPEPIRVSYTRAERAEAQALVFQCHLDHCNFRNGDTGIYDQQAGRFVRNLSVKMIASMCRLSLDRTERAISDLVAAGVLWKFQHRERDGDDWIGYVAFTRVTIKGFGLLGLEEERQERIQKEREEAARAAELERQAARRAAEAEARRADPLAHMPRTDRERLAALEWQIGKSNPGWTPEQVTAEALERLGLAPPPLPDPWPE